MNFCGKLFFCLFLFCLFLFVFFLQLFFFFFYNFVFPFLGWGLVKPLKTLRREAEEECLVVVLLFFFCFFCFVSVSVPVLHSVSVFAVLSLLGGRGCLSCGSILLCLRSSSLVSVCFFSFLFSWFGFCLWFCCCCYSCCRCFCCCCCLLLLLSLFCFF